MLEVLRSKLYYARAAAFIVVPDFRALAGGILRSLLERVKDSLQQQGVPGSHAALAADVFTHVLASRQLAGREYFGRIWTLSERLARGGRKETLNNWLSLRAWMGMVIDALLHTQEDRVTADLLWSNLFSKAVQKRLATTVEKLQKVQALGRLGSEGIEDDIASLCVDAVKAWTSSEMNETPDNSWLATYLMSEAGTVYKAFNERDCIWAIHSYFFQKEQVDVHQALEDLRTFAGVERSSLKQLEVSGPRQCNTIFEVVANCAVCCGCDVGGFYYQVTCVLIDLLCHFCTSGNVGPPTRGSG
jgi:hypothetical protein